MSGRKDHIPKKRGRRHTRHIIHFIGLGLLGAAYRCDQCKSEFILSTDAFQHAGIKDAL